MKKNEDIKIPKIKLSKEYIEAQFIQGVAKIAFSQSGIPNTIFCKGRYFVFGTICPYGN